MARYDGVERRKGFAALAREGETVLRSEGLHVSIVPIE
jgi:hypothetical protein